MSLWVTNPTIFAPVRQLYIYGFVPGPEVTRWSLVKELWAWNGAAWKKVMGAGADAPTGLQIVAFDDGTDLVQFEARWTLSPAGTPYSDYEIGGWYSHEFASPEFIAGDQRVITRATVGQQMHILSFKVRIRGSSDPYTESPLYYWQDPRPQT